MSPWRQEVAAQLRLAIPVVVIQVGLMLMGVVDTMMMGRVSPTHMAGVSIGHTYSFVFLAFGLGVLQALDPIVSQAFGARDEEAISRATQRGIVLAVLLSLPVALLMVPARWALELMRQDPSHVPVAADYCRIMIVGLPAFLIFVALRQTLQAQHRMRSLLFTIVCANVINALLDWVLIFGNLGFPALGATGCAWATSISRWVQVFALLVFAWPLLRPHLVPVVRAVLAPGPLLRMLRLGVPIGVQFTLEIGAFSVVSILMGSLGSSKAAGHNVALNLASLTFMVPLGLSMAASVRVGNEVGRGAADSARRAARVALVGGIAFMACTSAMFLIVPGPLARIYTDEAAVIAVAAALIPLAGVFQVFDGIQVVSGGVLRGVAETRFPMLVHLVGFWLFGIPLGCYLAFAREGGPRGLWWGLVAGLAAVASVLIVRVRVRLSRALKRVRIDDEPKRVPADSVGEPGT